MSKIVLYQTQTHIHYVSFWVVPRRLNYICRRFGTLYLFHLHRQVVYHLPMKMEQIWCSETSAYIIQTPGNYPKGNITYSEHGESLKSWIIIVFCCERVASLNQRCYTRCRLFTRTVWFAKSHCHHFLPNMYIHCQLHILIEFHKYKHKYRKKS